MNEQALSSSIQDGMLGSRPKGLAHSGCITSAQGDADRSPLQVLQAEFEQTCFGETLQV